MSKVLRVLIALPGIFFVVMGLRWLVDPAGAAAELGMGLLDGVGRSTQIGDMAAFFLALGTMILVGLITSQPRWLVCAGADAARRRNFPGTGLVAPRRRTGRANDRL